jgi:hypothetical protein
MQCQGESMREGKERTHRDAIIPSTAIATNGAIGAPAVLASTTIDWVSRPSGTLLTGKAPSPRETEGAVAGRSWSSGSKGTIVS